MSTVNPMATNPTELFRAATPDQICDWTHTNRTLRHVPSAAATLEDVLLPRYWSAAANMNLLTQNDIIICIPADSSWFAQLLVREVGPGHVRVMTMFAHVFEDTALPPGLSAQRSGDESFYYAGPILKWQVLGQNATVLKSGFNTQAEAAQWLAHHRAMQERTTGKGRT